MGPIERAIRRAVNPFSTRITTFVQGRGTRRAFRRGQPRLPRNLGKGPAPRPVAAWAGEAVAMVEVPNVIGVSWDRARERLRGIGLVAVGPGDETSLFDAIVVDQIPDAGVLLPTGARVMLWVERGPGSAGSREPRRPKPEPHASSGMLDEQSGEPIG